MSTHQPPERKPPISKTELRINRIIGVAVILVGAVLAYSLVFTEFHERVQFQWELNAEGERVPIIHVTCLSPWAVVTSDAQLEGAVRGDLCVLPARGKIVQGVFVAVAALAVGIWVFTRNNQPGPMPTLPPSLRASLWKR